MDIRLPGSRVRFGFVLIGLLIAAAALVGSARTLAADDYQCSCVVYAEAATGLPAGNSQTGYLPYASSYTETVMNELGWHRVVPPGDGTIPSGGKPMVMVMDAGAKGADPIAGHMAVVQQDPTYDYTAQLWTISVEEVDWPEGSCSPTPGTFTGRYTTNSGQYVTWGDLYGINFYVPD